jgi:hypothetical protein
MAVLNADVTLNYKSEVKLNPTLPPTIAQQASNGFNRVLPPESLMQFKGGKGLSSFMGITGITDFTKQEITLVDKEGKRYAIVPAAKIADEITAAMPPMSEQAKAVMASMKSHYSSKPGGGFATVQGMDAEEKQMEITVDMPAMPNVPAGPMMRWVGHVWTPKAPLKNPAIQEIAGMNLFAYANMNPAAMMAKVFQQMPGFGDAFEEMIKDVQSANVAGASADASGDVHADGQRNVEAESAGESRARGGIRPGRGTRDDEPGLGGNLHSGDTRLGVPGSGRAQAGAREGHPEGHDGEAGPGRRGTTLQ